MEKKYLVFNPLSGQYEEAFDENQIGPIKQRLAMELYNSMINGHVAPVIEEDDPIPYGPLPNPSIVTMSSSGSSETNA